MRTPKCFNYCLSTHCVEHSDLTLKVKVHLIWQKYGWEAWNRTTWHMFHPSSSFCLQNCKHGYLNYYYFIFFRFLWHYWPLFNSSWKGIRSEVERQDMQLMTCSLVVPQDFIFYPLYFAALFKGTTFQLWMKFRHPALKGEWLFVKAENTRFSRFVCSASMLEQQLHRFCGNARHVQACLLTQQNYVTYSTTCGSLVFLVIRLNMLQC